MTAALFIGAGLSLTVRVAVTLGRHDGPIGLAGLMLCIVACTRVIARKFDRSISTAHKLGRELEQRRVEREQALPLAPVREMVRR